MHPGGNIRPALFKELKYVSRALEAHAYNILLLWLWQSCLYRVADVYERSECC